MTVVIVLAATALVILAVVLIIRRAVLKARVGASKFSGRKCSLCKSRLNSFDIEDAHIEKAQNSHAVIIVKVKCSNCGNEESKRIFADISSLSGKEDIKLAVAKYFDY